MNKIIFSPKVQSSRNSLCLTDNLQKAVVCKWNVSPQALKISYSQKKTQTCCYKCSTPYSTLCLYISIWDHFFPISSHVTAHFADSTCIELVKLDINLSFLKFGIWGFLETGNVMVYFLKHSHLVVVECWVNCSLNICICYNIQFCILVLRFSDE